MRGRTIITAFLVVLLVFPLIGATASAADPNAGSGAQHFQKVKPIKVHGSDKPTGGPATGIGFPAATPGTRSPRRPADPTRRPVVGGTSAWAHHAWRADREQQRHGWRLPERHGRRRRAEPLRPGDQHLVPGVRQGRRRRWAAGQPRRAVADPHPLDERRPRVHGALCLQNSGDPVVLYDNLADRWLIAGFAPRANGNFICVAISQTADPRPSQGYYLYQFQFNNFPDYFKIGAWTDGYYVSANNGAATVAVFDRANMLNGGTAGGITDFATVADPGTGFNVLMPGDIDGRTAPPAGANNWYYRQVDGAFGAASIASSCTRPTSTGSPIRRRSRRW